MLRVFEDIFTDIGGCLMFTREIARTAVRTPCTLEQLCEQIWRVTMQSAATTCMAGFFVGAILAVQFTLQLKEFDAIGFLGGLATSGTFREIGPLLIAFMLSGKVGAYTSAELGTMRVTEQIDAIRCLGANPIREIILPRFVGIVISSFFLLMAGLIMSILGGMLMSYAFAGVNFEEYIRHIPTIVRGTSILSGLFKCFVFAIVLSSICTYRGYTTSGGAKGVGRAVVSTAVATMIGIVVADWLTTYFGDIAGRIFAGY